jgi:hypothetical protein
MPVQQIEKSAGQNDAVPATEAVETPQQQAQKRHLDAVRRLYRATSGEKSDRDWSLGLRTTRNSIDDNLSGVKAKDRTDAAILAYCRSDAFVDDVTEAAEKSVKLAQDFTEMLRSEHQSPLPGGSQPRQLAASVITAVYRQSASAQMAAAARQVVANLPIAVAATK